MGTVDLESVGEDEDIAELRELIEQHREFTRSPVAEGILDRWPEVLGEFVKVMPIDYKRVMQERRRHDEEMEASVREDGTARLRAIEH
jgi:glutamate synthase domain-containing protein 3